MPQHIRNQKQHVRQEQPLPGAGFPSDILDKMKNMVPSTMVPKQSFGTIVSILIFIILLAVLAAHFFGFITIPGLEGKLRKAAPSSHLQYFFF